MLVGRKIMIFKLKGLENDMTGQCSKPRGPRLLTVTGSQISLGVPCHPQPSSKPRRRGETENRQCDIACACVWVFLILLVHRARHGKRKDKDRNKQNTEELYFKHCSVICCHLTMLFVSTIAWSVENRQWIFHFLILLRNVSVFLICFIRARLSYLWKQ